MSEGAAANFALRCTTHPDADCNSIFAVLGVIAMLGLVAKICSCLGYNNNNGQAHAQAQNERLLEAQNERRRERARVSALAQQAQDERLRAQVEAQSRERNERLAAEAEAASAKAAQIQAARIAGLRVDGNVWPTCDGVYTKVGDNQGWPCYKKREVSSNKYLFRSVASKEWCIGREINDSSGLSRIKSVSGPVPTGTQTWRTWLPASKEFVARTFSVAEVVRHIYPSWFVRLGTQSGVDLTVQMFARRGRLRSSSTTYTTTMSSAS